MGTWVYLNSNTGTHIISGLYDNSNFQGFITYLINGDIVLRVGIPGAGNFANIPLTSYNVPLNQWIYVGFSYELSTTFVNGWIGDNNGFRNVIANNNTTISMINNTTQAYRLAGQSGNYYLDGNIGHFMTYDRNLSDAEHLQNWAWTKKNYGL